MRKGLFIGMLLAFLSLRGYSQESTESTKRHTVIATIVEITLETTPVMVLAKIGWGGADERTIAKSEIKKAFSWWDTSWQHFFKDPRAEFLVFKTNFIDLLEQSKISSEKKEKLRSVWNYPVETPIAFTVDPDCIFYAFGSKKSGPAELIKPNDRVELTYIIYKNVKIAVSMAVVSAPLETLK